MKNLTLITGAARSGKSKFAEQLAASQPLPVVYLATMQRCPSDAEQEERILMHQRRRPPAWSTIEAARQAHQVVVALQSDTCCIIDCLSLYVSNLLLQAAEQSHKPPFRHHASVVQEAEKLLESTRQRLDVHFFVVTNEVGWGIVPDNELGRAFRDMLGTVNQRFAQEAQEVWLTCVGLPLRLKPQPPY